jgi:hypothetical protein
MKRKKTGSHRPMSSFVNAFLKIIIIIIIIIIIK